MAKPPTYNQAIDRQLADFRWLTPRQKLKRLRRAVDLLLESQAAHRERQAASEPPIKLAPKQPPHPNP